MAKILLMDDDVVLGFELGDMLQLAGHEVQVVPTVAEALEELDREDYDLLITDIIVRVEGRTVPSGGITLISAIRQRESGRRLPIIAITGASPYKGMEDILTTAKQVGADASFEKPIDMDALLFEIGKRI